MATSVRIDCINKTDRDDPHERIDDVGGPNPDGTRWHLSLPDAIAGVREGKYAFYVERGGNRVNVVVAESRYGHLYLKTEADGEQPDNLLALPECG